MTDFSCNVSGALFLRAASIASVEPTRFYIQGVRIEPCKEGGALLVATNGGSLVALRDPVGEVTGAGSVLLPRSLRAALKPSRADRNPRLAIENNVANAGGLTATGVVQELKGSQYPDWRRAVPQEAGGATLAAFNVNILHDLASALCGDSKTPCVTITGADAQSAHVVTCSDPDAFGVIMPIRHEIKPAVRSWLGLYA